MNVEPKSKSVVTPAPYYKVTFGCGNRAFYGVKADIVEALSAAGLEPFDGYFSEKCDFEGDLEEIIIYRGSREEAAAQAVMNLYELTDVPADAAIHLSIF